MAADPSELAGAIKALRRRDGRMAELASEGGEVKLDWVESVARLLAQPELLVRVEQEAEEILRRGIRHIIWSGMGGSVMAVRVLTDMLRLEDDGTLGVYPLDSTDPAAINAVLRRIATAKGIELDRDGSSLDVAAFLGDVLTVGVAMGMTSEEPITHLEWFSALLGEAGLDPARHVLVMALPDSYLERFARERHISVLPIQPDGGTGTGGRMSAPTTRVFLLPAALALRASPGALERVLRRAWDAHDLEGAERDPLSHPFVSLAVALDAASRDGACRMVVHSREPWAALVPWIEQLMEESLGKGGKGVVVFPGDMSPAVGMVPHEGALAVWDSDKEVPAAGFGLRYPLELPGRPVPPGVQVDHGGSGIAGPVLEAVTGAGGTTYSIDTAEEVLVAVAAAFLGWQLTMALYGFLNGITCAGQPAVEDYKARARALRDSHPAGRRTESPLDAVTESGVVICGNGLTVLCPPGLPAGTPERALAAALGQKGLWYVDLTVNGRSARVAGGVLPAARRLAMDVLRVPLKAREAPAAYHSTEQSEMDGPSRLVSIRLVVRQHERVLLGRYDDRFLLAQAAGTWQAMVEKRRMCFLLIAADEESLLRETTNLFNGVAILLSHSQ